VDCATAPSSPSRAPDPEQIDPLTDEAQSAGTVTQPSAGALELVLRRFPERTERVELCYAQLAAFREICEDYAEVQRAWEAASAAHPRPAMDELQVLLAELEAELVSALEGRSVLRMGGAGPAGCDE
jgi:hypothetical protein